MPNKFNKVNFIHHSIKITVLLFIALYFSGCVTVYNEATQRKETYLIGTENEISLGQNLDKQIQKDIKVLTDEKKQQRLDSIGKKVAAVSDRKDVTYSFKIVDDKELNAFAIPGGFIYVNSGLIERANDNELAGVIGHEIGHIAARHSVKRLQAVMGYQLLIAIPLGISGQDTIGQAVDIVFSLVNLGYSRQDEFLADKLAVKYTSKSGYDPHGIVSFFQILAEEGRKKGNTEKLVFLSSHPPIDERIKNAQAEIQVIMNK